MNSSDEMIQTFLASWPRSQQSQWNWTGQQKILTISSWTAVSLLTTDSQAKHKTDLNKPSSTLSSTLLLPVSHCWRQLIKRRRREQQLWAARWSEKNSAQCCGCVFFRSLLLSLCRDTGDRQSLRRTEYLNTSLQTSLSHHKLLPQQHCRTAWLSEKKGLTRFCQR